MKALLALFIVSSVSAWAQNTCKSAYVSRPYKACLSMTDTSRPGLLTGTIPLQSEEMSGGADQIAVCQNLQNSFNLNPANQAAGLIAALTSPSPIGESSKKDWGRATYRYTCSVAVTQYPLIAVPHSSCGSTGNWAYDSNVDPTESEVRCLSCDDLDNQSVEAVVTCLQANIKEIVQSGSVTLRSEDLQSMKVKVNQVLELSKYRPVSNLQTLEQIMLFVEFVK